MKITDDKVIEQAVILAHMKAALNSLDTIIKGYGDADVKEDVNRVCINLGKLIVKTTEKLKEMMKEES